MRILVTGASGCIGHYICESLIQDTEHELFLFLRNPAKLNLDTTARPGITVIQGDMLDLEPLAEILPTLNVAILTATMWGGDGIFQVNVSQTLALMGALNPEVCQKVFYFSTASVLDRHLNPLPEAGTIGTDYIRSKFECLQELESLPIADRIVELFPTLVFGGGGDGKPTSHITGGLGEALRWLWLAKCFAVDGSFHFVHGRDIAQVVTYLIQHPEVNPGPRLVLGNPRLTVSEMLQEMCDYTGQRIYVQVPLQLWLVNILIKVFRLQMAAWDYFCVQYRHFSYDKVVNPQGLGLTPYCGSLTRLLELTLSQ